MAAKCSPRQSGSRACPGTCYLAFEIRTMEVLQKATVIDPLHVPVIVLSLVQGLTVLWVACCRHSPKECLSCTIFICASAKFVVIGQRTIRHLQNMHNRGIIFLILKSLLEI